MVSQAFYVIFVQFDSSESKTLYSFIKECGVDV